MEMVVQSIIQEAALVKTFVLKTEGKLVYQPGQFLTLLFPSEQTGEAERRAYSFSSTPGVDVFPSITIKRTANGFASRQMIDNVKEGDRLMYSHVSGKFTLPEQGSPYQQIVFFAAGSGIVPVFSLLKAIFAFHPGLKVTLVYSSHRREDTLFYDELQQLHHKNKERFRILWRFSRTDNNQILGRLSHFSLLEILNDKHLLPHDKTLFYLCGPFEYMDTITIVLKTEGILPEQIKQEHFYIPRENKPPAPPDKTPRKVTLRLGKQTYTFLAGYPDSILSAALKQGIPLHFSCRSGQCGSCAVTCLEGNVWMQYNEVLTEKELQQGMRLTCCGFPDGKPVVLEKHP